jgi:ATP/maltotriose-dependent transcriptional regulator MalT
MRKLIDAGEYDTAIALARSKSARGAGRDVTLLLGKALALGGHSADASRLLDEIVEESTRDGDSESAARALDLLWWLGWIELDGERARAVADRMLKLTIPATSPEAFRIFVAKAALAVQLGDAATAAEILEETEHDSRDADIDGFANYLSVKADVLAASGRPAEALSYARLAADIGAKRSDLFLRWRRLLYLAYMLQANGRLSEAYEAYLNAESAARDASLTWEVAFSRARAAWVALLLGRGAAAHDLVVSCLDEPYDQGWMAATRSAVGIFVGLCCEDEKLLARSADPRVLDKVLSSSDYYTVGPTVAAFHAYYRHVGKQAEANALLELGISILPSPDCGWSLFPFVARNGSDSAVRRAQELLGKYPREHRVAEAHRQFFEALLAARYGRRVECERRAGEAQLLFDDFECHMYAARCLELAGRLAEAHRRYSAMGMPGEARRIAHARGRRGRPRRSYESSRERREILQLLLQGLTSASIAERLGVSERTIKSRISEIYDFEGVRNRAELLGRHKLPAGAAPALSTIAR